MINGDGGQTRDYVFVEDVARVNALAVESSVTGALNVGTARETSVNDLAERLARAVGGARQFRHGPAKPGEQRRSAIDPAAAQAALGWSPRVDLEQGLQDTAAWFRSRTRA